MDKLKEKVIERNGNSKNIRKHNNITINVIYKLYITTQYPVYHEESVLFISISMFLIVMYNS